MIFICFLIKLFKVFTLSKKLDSRREFFWRIAFYYYHKLYFEKYFEDITIYMVKHFFFLPHAEHVDLYRCAQKNYIFSVDAYLWSVLFFSGILECLSRWVTVSLLRLFTVFSIRAHYTLCSGELRPNINFSHFFP